MKILCVIDDLGPGGAQRQLVNLAIGFKGKEHTVSFLVYHENNFYQRTLEEYNIPVKKIIEPNYLKRLLKMRRYIRRGGFDGVLSFLQAANFICEIAGLPWRKWRLLVGERSANPNIFKSSKLMSYRWFHLLADYVVSNSYTNIKMVRKINPLLAPRKCKVIYNAIDFKKWKPATDYIPCKDGKFHIIVVASHRYLKNLNGLVEAVNLLSGEEKNKLRVDWFGSDHHDQSKTKALIKIIDYKLNHIFTFHKPTNEIHKRVQRADAVGLFSFYEGLPNTVCEGMAAAKPVISSKVSDVPLLISSEQMIFDPYNSNEIAKTISNLMNLSIKKLLKIGVINYHNAVFQFNANHVIANYLELLESE